MAKPELGIKRLCVSCSARFFDLGKSPAVCPKCGAEQPPDQPRPKRSPLPPADEKRVKAPQAPGLDDGDVEVEGDDDDEDVLEDTSDLEDDADSLGAEIVVAPDSDEPER